MKEHSKSLNDYIDFLKRRKRSILLTILLIVLFCTYMITQLTDIYRSTATILIENQQIPSDLVRSTVTGFADQRIEIIRRRVLSRARLYETIVKYKLYNVDTGESRRNAILDQMMNDVSVKLLSAELGGQSGGHQNAAIAFTLSYEGGSPTVTQEVASELAHLFLTENLKIREKNAQETTAFLKLEGEKLLSRTKEIENKIAVFKEKNSETLPELANFNMKALEQTNRDLMGTEQQIRSLEDRMIYLEGQLTTLKPTLPINTAEGKWLPDRDQLKVLRSEYVRLSAKLSPQHPDLMRLNREIKALAGVLGEENNIADLRKELAVEQVRMRKALEQYGKNHPDVIQLRRIISSLQNKISEVSQVQDESRRVVPDNPAYITMKAQLASTKNDLKSLMVTRKQLKKLRISISERLKAAPMVEKEYENLNRNRENLDIKYQEIRSKLLEAELAEGLESQQKGERFSLIEPPILPEAPVKPNRPALLFLSLIFALAGGLVSGIAAEALDHSVFDGHEIERISGSFPLSIVPFILNEEDRKRMIKSRISYVAGAVGLTIVFLMGIYLAVTSP